MGGGRTSHEERAARARAEAGYTRVAEQSQSVRGRVESEGTQASGGRLCRALKAFVKIWYLLSVN